MSLSRLVDEVLSLVKLDLYAPRGVVAGDRLLVSALREGASNLYLLEEGRLVRLNREPISGVAEPPYGAGRVVLFRDVARGRELHRAYIVEVDKPGEEEPLTEDLEPMRLFGIVDKGSRVYLTGVTATGIALYEVEPRGAARKVADLPGLSFLLDAHNGVGAGAVFQQDATITLFTVDLETGEVRMHSHPGSVSAVRFTSGGDLIVALEEPGGLGLYRIDPDTGSREPLDLPHRDLEEYRPRAANYLSTLPGGEVLVVARRDGRSRVFVDGKEIPGPTGTYGAAYSWRDGLAVSYTSLKAPTRVLHLRDGGWSEVLAPETPGWLTEALGDTGFHWVESFDGERVPVFTLESRRAGRPGPTVVLVHGGPFAEDLDAWDVIAAALALTGFNVVMPNYRGSTGYGDEWRSKIIGDPCGGELEDIVAAARWAVEQGLASYNVVMGYSYGGYATMCALTRKPGVFKAGVAGASVVDWEGMYELSDPAFRQLIELLLGEDRGRWRERSPINYVENLREPLCIIHPQNDSRTPLKPVLRFMEKALEAGKTFEAHIAPDMGHAIMRVEDIVKILLPAVVFLHRIRGEGAG